MNTNDVGRMLFEAKVRVFEAQVKAYAAQVQSWVQRMPPFSSTATMMSSRAPRELQPLGLRTFFLIHPREQVEATLELLGWTAAENAHGYDGIIASASLDESWGVLPSQGDYHCQLIHVRYALGNPCAWSRIDDMTLYRLVQGTGLLGGRR